MRIYMDNCCYYRPFDDQKQIAVYLETQAKLHIQKLIKEGKLELVYSYISKFENGNSPNKENRGSVDRFFEFARVFVDVDKADEAEKLANDIVKQGLKSKDALHIACAIIEKCDYFLTTDKEILNKYKSEKILVCSPITFLGISEVSNV
ncbi:MAG: PIN domain-containing protein [Fibromonadaceae bacterium]|nr:PIN domain-containing protein [Fibromonadaceae bacterium]